MLDLHILLDPVTDFCRCPKKGLRFLPRGGLIESTKTQFKNLKFWPK